MIVQAVVLWEKILNVLLGIKMGRDTLHSRLPRSSSIDSMVEAVWAEEAAAEPVAAAEKRPSLRADRPLAIVSPSVGRRMKGQRGINGEWALGMPPLRCFVTVIKFTTLGKDKRSAGSNTEKNDKVAGKKRVY
ncbi:hypothetical protein TcasGA2_TC034181 [Tribolium castaneum]|uniref:Uncharacterized protein n=1 Tax=Tribolium castaneum TaxID=7070 RepID=A0A139WCM0_TRICA|nr:hypothetical protein TcasGA2_TC034181 [Tribolium castaneum]